MKKIKQAVVLAAGDGTRMWPVSAGKPKVLAPLLSSTILERKLKNLSSFVEETILVVGEGEEKIKKTVGGEYEKMKVHYVSQNKRLGTAHALRQCENLLEDRFLVVNGDDFYGASDLKRVADKFPSILTKEVDDISSFGAVFVEGDSVRDLIEKPDRVSPGLANVGAYFLPKEVLSQSFEKSKRGEYEITDLVRDFARKNKLYFKKAKNWFPLSYPWHVLTINNFLLFQKQESFIEGSVDKGVDIVGPVVIRKGAFIKSGTRIEGPVFIGKNVVVGPNAYLREGSVVRDGCKIGHSVEIKNSILGEKSRVSHLSYVGDSVLGRECSLGAGTITANLRFDGKEVKAKVKRKMVNTRRRKFGCALGSGVKTGVNVSLMPGVLLGKEVVVYPHVKVSRNVEDGQVFK